MPVHRRRGSSCWRHDFARFAWRVQDAARPGLGLSARATRERALWAAWVASSTCRGSRIHANGWPSCRASRICVSTDGLETLPLLVIGHGGTDVPASSCGDVSEAECPGGILVLELAPTVGRWLRSLVLGDGRDQLERPMFHVKPPALSPVVRGLEPVPV